MSEKIKVKISKNGEIDYSVEGVKGKGCKDLTKFIDNMSGGVVDSKNTGEYCQLPEKERIKQR